MADKPFSKPSSLTEQLQNLCWRLATEMRSLYTAIGQRLDKTSADALYLGIKGKAASAGAADTATKATKDASGNVITATYATKAELAGDMTGATASAAGTSGLVPAPAAGKQTSFLRGDGTWVVPTNTTYSTATTSKAGLMSAADKSKVDASVLTSSQSLTAAQKKQALANIGAVSYLDNTLTEAQAIQTLKNLKFDVGSAAFANSIWGGRNLLDIYTEAQINSKVAAGDFSGMFIGDYITKTITVDGTAYTNVWRCAHFDYYLGIGDTECTTHHIVMVPDGIVGTVPMNSTNATTGGFKGSAMWTTTLPKYTSALQSAFGSAHVLKHRYLITDSMNSSLMSMAGANWTGAVPIWSWEWIDCYANLMTEHMVYGQPIYSSSAADSASYHTQLALFHLRPQLIHCRSSWWLSAVASSDYFANVHWDGYADAGHASYSYGVRPLFLWS